MGVSHGTSEVIMIRFLKRSIKREYTFVFGLLLSLCICLISVVNVLTLGPAYMKKLA